MVFHEKLPPIATSSAIATWPAIAVMNESSRAFTSTAVPGPVVVTTVPAPVTSARTVLANSLIEIDPARTKLSAFTPPTEMVTRSASSWASTTTTGAVDHGAGTDPCDHVRRHPVDGHRSAETDLTAAAAVVLVTLRVVAADVDDGRAIFCLDADFRRRRERRVEHERLHDVVAAFGVVGECADGTGRVHAGDGEHRGGLHDGDADGDEDRHRFSVDGDLAERAWRRSIPRSAPVTWSLTLFVAIVTAALTRPNGPSSPIVTEAATASVITLSIASTVMSPVSAVTTAPFSMIANTSLPTSFVPSLIWRPSNRGMIAQFVENTSWSAWTTTSFVACTVESSISAVITLRIRWNAGARRARRGRSPPTRRPAHRGRR